MVQSSPTNGRRGSAVVPLAALLMTFLIAMVAFAVDLGYVAVARNELQNAADAAALAGASQLMSKEAQAGAFQDALYYDGDNKARREAQRFGQANRAGGVNLVLGLNVGNAADGDIVVGHANPDNPREGMRLDVYPYNSVQVRVYRNAAHSGSLELFFGRVLGRDKTDVAATATATLTGSPWEKLLPITMHVDDYRRLLDGPLDPGETDDFSFNPDQQPLGPTYFANRVSGSETSPQPDGVREFRLYPDQGGSPGNFGTVDLGVLNGSVVDLRRQIKSGLSASDRSLMKVAGQLTNDRFVASELAPVGVSGDPGISWTIEDDLHEIIGQSRTIPVYESVVRSGTVGTYATVGFVNVVVHTNRNGQKEITVQPIAPYTILDSPDQNMLGSLLLTR